MYLSILLLLQITATSPGTMSADERLALLDYTKHTKQYFLGMLEDVDPESWHFKPGAERWSIAECAEHILTTELLALAEIKNQLSSEAATPHKTSAVGSIELLLNIVNDRVNKRIKTEEAMEPEGKWASKAEFLAAYQASQAAFKDFVKETSAEVHHHFRDSPLGKIDLYEFLYVTVAHTARHTMQIEDIKALRGLTTSSLHFGGSVKVNCLHSDQERIQWFFKDLLHLELNITEEYDQVLFEGEGSVVFFYQDTPDQVLTEDQFLNAMQAALLIPAPQYDSLKRRIKASGMKEVFPERDQSRFFYFHAPGGQVFRLVKKE